MINEIRKNAGLENEYLTEGIKYFKESNKLKRLVKVLEKKIPKLSDEERKNIQELREGVIKLIKEYEKIEADFSKAQTKQEKDQLKLAHKSMGKKFTSVLKMATKEDTKKVLISTGLAAIVGGALASGLLPLHFGLGISSTLLRKFTSDFKGPSDVSRLDQSMGQSIEIE